MKGDTNQSLLSYQSHRIFQKAMRKFTDEHITADALVRDVKPISSRSH